MYVACAIGVRILIPNKIPCKRTDVPQDVIGAQTVVSQQSRTPTNPAHNHEAHAPASSSSGVNRSPAFMNPANPGSAPMARQGMVETQKNYGQHNQDIDDAAKAMESVFGDPSKAKGNPSQNSGNHEARRKGGSSGNGNSGSSAGNNGSSAASHEAHGGAGDTKK
jgi:hypothetical protein